MDMAMKFEAPPSPLLSLSLSLSYFLVGKLAVVRQQEYSWSWMLTMIHFWIFNLFHFWVLDPFFFFSCKKWMNLPRWNCRSIQKPLPLTNIKVLKANVVLVPSWWSSTHFYVLNSSPPIVPTLTMNFSSFFLFSYW